MKSLTLECSAPAGSGGGFPEAAKGFGAELQRALAAEGRGVVLAIHDLCLALRGADRIVVLSEGRACAKGTAEEIWESGVLGQVFGVEVRRTNTPAGWRYYYE